MADRDDQSNLPPIPDGGLTESMPDWLRRPPAWRTLSDREVASPAPEDASTLPEPDESVIDPRTFLSDDDLPEWLRNLGQRRHAVQVAKRDAAAVPSDKPQLASGETESSKRDRAAERIATERRARFVPTSPPAPVSTATPSQVARETGPRPLTRSQPASGPAWQGAWIVAILAAALVVALVVIGLLVI